ncbi:MAG: response regulator transcription factor, partial [Planctomycetes bacterium]|nr:response regulator transcription factor [Planctomycetota bacterium]
MKLLLVEDSLRLQRSLRIGLERSGFRVDVAGDGKAALDWARSSSYDIIVLDLMLPKLDGLSVLRALRASENPVHVLVLSARGTPSERIEGLQAGADDYLAKPFEFDELVARARALVRRKFGCKQTVFEVGPYRFDTSRRTLTCE